MKRMIIGALLAGVTVFVWSSISHLVLGLGAAGIGKLANEDAVLQTLSESGTESGLYILPGLDLSAEPSEQEMEAFAEKHRRGPRGYLVYHSTGSEPLSPAQLLAELLSNILAALLAAILISRIPGGLGVRVGAIVLLAVFGWININFSYWNWYGFPLPGMLAELVDHTVAWLLAGLVLAKLVPAE